MTGVVRVLLVEDDDTIAAPLTKGLEREGFLVSRVASGGEALADGEDADVVLLDLGLPDLDGYEVCRRLRAVSEVPIIVVTARSEEVDRVIGLELGADDYVVKPFGLRELIARIRAVTRRSRRSAFFAPVDGSSQSVGALTIDRRTRRVTVDGSEVALTPREFDLLAFLVQEPDTVHRRQHILEEVWDPHWWGPTRTLDVHVAALRRKLGHPEWIETVRGVGFRFRPPG